MRTSLDRINDRDADRHAEWVAELDERKEWEAEEQRAAASELQHLFLHRPDAKHHRFATYTSRQLVDEAMDPDVHIPRLLELARRAANGEDISDDAGDLVHELSGKCVADNLETFLRSH